MEKSEEQKGYEEFMDQFEDYMLSEDGENFESFYAYGPLSNKYWTFKPRILVCNLEPYDEREGKTLVDINLYKEWIKAPTGKYTAKFITGLINTLNQEVVNESINFNNFSDKELLSNMENVAYMNFRISSGNRVAADKKGILKEVQGFKGYLFDQINKLSSDIIIVGGVEGCKAFNLLFGAKLEYNTTSIFNGKVICSIKHFSRANYKIYNEKIIEILNCSPVMEAN